MMKNSFDKGFTLIELLVVISIIAVLASLGAVSYSGAQTRARDAQRKNDGVQIKNALQLYWNDNKTYVGAAFSDASLGAYMKSNSFPLDPKDKSITYVLDSTSVDTYSFHVCLETSLDSSRDATNLCTSPRVSMTFSGP